MVKMMSMDLLTLNKRLKTVSFDDFVSILYTFSDEDGFLSPDQMLIFGVTFSVPLHIPDFLDLFLYSRLLN